MIQIIDKTNCCGCSSCAQACPKQCIAMQEDEQGFTYPVINEDLCVDCHLCEKVCPCLHPGDSHQPIKILGAVHPAEKVRMKSSSGGIFSLLASDIIKDSGVVFGARFDAHWSVMHDYTETLEGIAAFRGSKYVQSVLGDSFKLVRQFLRDGRKVLFSGTPCQIAALKRFLRKDDDLLYLVEIACHGVPSPKVWRHYLAEEQKNRQIAQITDIDFRDKTYGWNGYHFTLHYKKPNGSKGKFTVTHGDNPFYRGFLNHLFIRPSCFQCPAKSFRSGADITLADFWGVHQLNAAMDDNRGISTVCVNSEKGMKFLSGLLPTSAEYAYQDIIRFNPALVRSISQDTKSQQFWASDKGIIATVEQLCGDSFILKIKKTVSSLLFKKQVYYK